ncbi:hypothetical protein TELCIR_14147, partial [Teladorsagia circumcincta]
WLTISAQTYPKSNFTGIDVTLDAVHQANQRRKDNGETFDNLAFIQMNAGAMDADWTDKYDVVTIFDACHDQMRPDLKAAREADDEIKDIEDQIRVLLDNPLLSLEETRSAEKRPALATSEPSIITAHPVVQSCLDQQHTAEEIVPGTNRVEKRKCKLTCGSTTHQYATECDIFSTLTDRRDRMRELKICFVFPTTYRSQSRF